MLLRNVTCIKLQTSLVCIRVHSALASWNKWRMKLHKLSKFKRHWTRHFLIVFSSTLKTRSVAAVWLVYAGRSLKSTRQYLLISKTFCSSTVYCNTLFTEKTRGRRHFLLHMARSTHINLVLHYTWLHFWLLILYRYLHNHDLITTSRKRHEVHSSCSIHLLNYLWSKLRAKFLKCTCYVKRKYILIWPLLPQQDYSMHTRITDRDNLSPTNLVSVIRSHCRHGASQPRICNSFRNMSKKLYRFFLSFFLLDFQI